MERLQVSAYDGVILDIGLPHINGLELLGHIRKLHGDMPIIMVTASGAKQRAVQALSLRCSGLRIEAIRPCRTTTSCPHVVWIISCKEHGQPDKL